ncbi:hypothetical protein CEXT_405271 [Caerostris extrusa]|uniref:Uncharacterized protein n=1 Tax=Caerostris extrusa TaxID=172846 RepID=A0AAV4VHR9_CAEEX|nr:hypothetical protein CEXT_405271 [Caerostris extrusa]
MRGVGGEILGESWGSSGGINYSTGTLISKPFTRPPYLMNSATPCRMQMNAFQRQTRVLTIVVVRGAFVSAARVAALLWERNAPCGDGGKI